MEVQRFLVVHSQLSCAVRMEITTRLLREIATTVFEFTFY